MTTTPHFTAASADEPFVADFSSFESGPPPEEAPPRPPPHPPTCLPNILLAALEGAAARHSKSKSAARAAQDTLA